jgi:hypothetical protein
LPCVGSIRDGDDVEVIIDGVGSLKNTLAQVAGAPR